MRRLLFCLLLLTTLIVGIAAFTDSMHVLAAGPLPPIRVVPHPHSTTLLTVKGSGIKQTATFIAPVSWTLAWTCNPASFHGFNYNVIVYVYRSTSALANVAINAICTKTTTHGSTHEHISGPLYLSINSEAAWTVRAYAP